MGDAPATSAETASRARHLPAAGPRIAHEASSLLGSSKKERVVVSSSSSVVVIDVVATDISERI